MALKKIIDKINKLSLPLKIQLVIAILCTMSIPVYAWFAYQDRIEAFSKIKEPPSLNLASGGEDPALYISLENIDVNASNHEMYVVFSVEPGEFTGKQWALDNRILYNHGRSGDGGVELN